MHCPVCGTDNPVSRVSCLACRAALGLVRAPPDQAGAGALLTEGLRRTFKFLLVALFGGVIALLCFRFIFPQAARASSWIAILAVVCGGLAACAALGLVGPALIGLLRDFVFKMRLRGWRRRIRAGLDRVIARCQREKSAPDVQFRLGTALYLKGERERAFAVLEEAAKESPQDPIPIHNRAVVQAAQNRFAQALEGFREALALGADASVAEANMALAMASSASPAEAAGVCRKAWQSARGRPDLLNNLVVCLAQAGHNEEALARIQNGLTEDPTNPDLLINLGAVRLRQGDLDGAWQGFFDACIHEPVPHLGHHNAGIMCLLQGRMAKAREFLSAVLNEGASFPPSLGQLAFVYRAANQKRRALETLQEAARGAPTDFEIRHNLCVFLLEEGREEALAEAQKAAELRPDDHDALLNLTAAACLARRYHIALEESRKAATLFPESAPARHNLGLALGALERYEEAVQQLQWLTERYPNFAAAWGNLGAIRLLAGETVDAASALMCASDLDPKQRDVRINLALAYYLEGDATASIKELDAARQDGADSPSSLDIRGHIHADKRPGDAIVPWAELSTMEPTNVELLTNLGIAYYRDDQSDAAIERFRKVLLHSPRSIIAHNNLALAYAKNKLLTEALHHINKVVEMQPDNPVVHSNAGLIHYFRDDTERAMHHWREVTRLSPEYARRREATRLSTYDDSQMVVFPINRQKRVSRFPPLFAPCHHEPRFSVPPPRFFPLLPWPDLAEIWSLQEKLQAAQRRVQRY